MKSTMMYLLLCTICWGIQGNIPSPQPDIFAGATPCDAVARSFLSIPQDLDCEMIQWRMTLRRDPRSLNRDAFDLQYTYGMTKPGTQGFMNNGFKKEMSGTWTLRADTGKQICVLKPVSNPSFSFLRLNDHLMHLLDSEGKLMIGNAGYSYTLNKQNQ